jgi:hypothetical protein
MISPSFLFSRETNEASAKKEINKTPESYIHMKTRSIC